MKRISDPSVESTPGAEAIDYRAPTASPPHGVLGVVSFALALAGIAAIFVILAIRDPGPSAPRLILVVPLTAILGPMLGLSLGILGASRPGMNRRFALLGIWLNLLAIGLFICLVAWMDAND